LFSLAESLGLPAVSPIRKFVQIDDGALVVERITEDGAQRVRVELPALIGVSSEVNQPRYPAMKGVLIAKRAAIPTWRRSDLGLGDPERRVEVRRLFVETREAKTELIAGDSAAAIGARLAERLREAGLI
jgi:electron transfer flavoprotein alpha/beta subunit